MSLTVAELKALNLGYLSGADLLQFCVAPLLIKCYEADNDSLQNGCSTAYVQLDGNLSSRYDVESELALTTGRNLLCVKITAIIAIQNNFAWGAFPILGKITKIYLMLTTKNFWQFATDKWHLN